MKETKDFAPFLHEIIILSSITHYMSIPFGEVRKATRRISHDTRLLD